MARRAGRWGAFALGAALIGGAAAVSVPRDRADAFKPYTHSKTGQNAYSDVIADGRVTIEGREYSVNPKLVAALRAWPAHYNAGVIGPDGFPDLVMGQSVIHPDNTGRWLRHLLNRAWQAQDYYYEPGAAYDDPDQNPDYNDSEEGQILAFTYGFLTHAAGDVWAHTLVNELSKGIFPGALEILDPTNKTAREIALRHILLEGYIGAATPGYDNDPNESLLPNGDVAPDATERIAFAAPHRFIFDTMISQWSDVRPPTDDRGKVINFFQGLRNNLDAWVQYDPDPIATVVGHFNAFVNKWELERRPARCDGRDSDGDGRVDEGCGFFEIADFSAPSRDEGASGNCNFGAGYDPAFAAIDFVRDLPACIVVMGLSAVAETVGAITGAVTETVAYLAKQVLNAYVREWINDIDVGLQNWSELGLAITKGLFDPQTKRDAQNFICRNQGPDVLTSAPAGSETNSRRRCENSVGTVDTVMFAVDDFMNEHLLPMLGLPDWFGSIREALDSIGNLAADGFAAALGPAYVGVADAVNGLTQPIKDWAVDVVEAALSERFGIPVQDIKLFLEEPTTRIDTTAVTIPGRRYTILGLTDLNIPTQTLDVLGPSVRAVLDRYLGLPAHAPFTPLGTSERFSATGFRAYRNAVSLSKMLLLDGAGMDQLISDLVGAEYSLYNSGYNYGDPASNVMTTTMPDADGPWDQWLKSIDGDHAWRQDGLPVFTDPDHHAAGEGNFPLFESCLLRKRVFRRIFKDWENDVPSRGGDGDGVLDAAENFPDLGDEPTPDPSAPPSPLSMLSIGYPRVIVNGQVFVTPSTQLSISVAAVGSGIGTQWRARNGIDDEVPFKDLAPGRFFRLGDSGITDGSVDLEYTTEDACFGGDPTVTGLVVDARPPIVYFPFPEAGTEFDTNSTPDFYFDTSDGDGVGTDESSLRFILNGRVIPNGYQVYTGRMRAGIHTLQVLARDLLGNTTVRTATFKVRATLDSLSENLTTAFESKRISDPRVFEALQAMIAAAASNHSRGRHAAEWKILRTFIAEMERLRGEVIDLGTAGRLASYAESIITDESSPQQQFAPGASRRAGSRA